MVAERRPAAHGARAGRLRVFHDGKLDPTPIAGVPEVRITALGGLLEVLPHPKFAQNALVYFSYSKGGESNLSTTAVARGKLVGHEIQGIKDVFVAKNWSNSATNFGGRMVFGRTGCCISPSASAKSRNARRTRKKISNVATRPDLEPPFMYFVPSIAISGMTFYTGDKLKAWKGNAFVGSMMEGRTKWTGHIRRITFSDDGLPIQREPILRELRQRIRDVRMGPDELLYVLTDENPGVQLRIEPAE